jgi:hypothetical protein
MGHVMTIPQLLLETPIRVGDELLSQVWKGTMTSVDLPDMPPAPVVIKLFEESHFTHIMPTLDDFCGNFEHADWIPGARLAANEAWAFDRMRALQGQYLISHVRLHSWLVLQAVVCRGLMAFARYVIHSHRSEVRK